MAARRRYDRAKADAARLRDEEYRRLLYVALTRAEDRLYVCGWATKRAAPSGNWHELVAAGLEAGGKAEPFDFAGDGGKGWGGPGWRLVSRQTKPAISDKQSVMAKRAPVAEPEWLRKPPDAEPTPPRPLAPSRPAMPDPPARSPLDAAGADKFLRGRLVHRLLQSLPDLPPLERTAAGRRYLSLPVHGLAPADRDAILAETLAVLARDDFAPIFGPQSRAEVPVVAVLGDRRHFGPDRPDRGPARSGADRRLQDPAPAARRPGRGAASLSSSARGLSRGGGGDLPGTPGRGRDFVDGRADSHADPGRATRSVKGGWRNPACAGRAPPSLTLLSTLP